MMNAWRQREKRDGIKLNWIDFELPVESDEVFVEKFRNAITDKTKIVHITHMLNWTGQILPARKIADMAHAKGCEVVVDASHTFAHIDYKIPELDCDYYATSLHKWLCAPFGSGLLYIKKDKIKNVWALLSAPIPDADNIEKFECLGTRSFASEMAIGHAIDFHLMIGAKRKEERLRYLKNYWYKKASAIPGIKLYTSLKPEYSCAIASIHIEGWERDQIADWFFEKKKIHIGGVFNENVYGVRITPHVYTSLYDLDLVAEGLAELVKNSPKKR
jgi:selenocysteine lyase/cysteine desulfurase